jgi:hypothetical protein
MTTTPTTPPDRSTFRPARRRVTVVTASIAGAAALALGGIAAAGASSSTSTQPSSFVAIAPVTIAGNVAIRAGGQLSPTVAGIASVPAAASSVQLTVNVTATTASSVLFVFPNGSSTHGLPIARWRKGQSVADTVTVRVGTNHKIVFKNTTGRARIHAQITGYYQASRLPRALVASGIRQSITRDPSPVINLDLPSGTFLVTATGSVSSPADHVDDTRCLLRDAAHNDNDHNLATALGTAGFVGDFSQQSSMTLQAVVSSTSETLVLMCGDDAGTGSISDARITAVEVGALTGA